MVGAGKDQVGTHGTGEVVEIYILRCGDREREMAAGEEKEKETELATWALETSEPIHNDKLPLKVSHLFQQVT